MKLRALEALEDRPRKTMACPTAKFAGRLFPGHRTSYYEQLECAAYLIPDHAP